MHGTSGHHQPVQWAGSRTRAAAPPPAPQLGAVLPVIEHAARFVCSRSMMQRVQREGRDMKEGGGGVREGAALVEAPPSQATIGRGRRERYTHTQAEQARGRGQPEGGQEARTAAVQEEGQLALGGAGGVGGAAGGRSPVGPSPARLYRYLALQPALQAPAAPALAAANKWGGGAPRPRPAVHCQPASQPASRHQGLARTSARPGRGSSLRGGTPRPLPGGSSDVAPTHPPAQPPTTRALLAAFRRR